MNNAYPATNLPVVMAWLYVIRAAPPKSNLPGAELARKNWYGCNVALTPFSIRYSGANADVFVHMEREKKTTLEMRARTITKGEFQHAKRK